MNGSGCCQPPLTWRYASSSPLGARIKLSRANSVYVNLSSLCVLLALGERIAVPREIPGSQHCEMALNAE